MLERDQAAIAATLLGGPAHLPAGLFAGDEDAALRGMRVHATTISHARLVALEETFPRTRDHLGEGAFNRLSHAFVDAGGARGRALSHIGAGFADWLGGEAAPPAADLARAEWAWLETYHAADAPALTLAELAALDEAALLALPVRRHPAVRVVTLAGDAAPLLDPALPAGTAALLLTRPEAGVRIAPATAAEADALDRAEKTTAFGNLIERLVELHPDGGAVAAMLVAAGAFERVRR